MKSTATAACVSMELAKPNGESRFPEAVVGTDELLPTQDEVADILRRATGIATINPRHIEELTRLGVYVRGLGVLRRERGSTVVTQAWLDQSLQAAVECLTRETARGDKTRLAHVRGLSQAIALLAGAKNKTQELSLELEKAAAPSGKPDEVEAPRNVPFPTGSIGPIITTEQVHIHEEKKVLPSPVEGHKEPTEVTVQSQKSKVQS